ncbi:MAG TPA: cytochrome b/b6 domain-containing protein [Candidatus Limnocylindria bacterium]|nr:cytochrome b/b6 domain-containing protein [Candidatus Limnocylindria bacterium]
MTTATVPARTKPAIKAHPFAVLSDAVLLLLAVGGAVWLLIAGTPAVAWNTDRSLFPLSVDGSRALLFLTAVGAALGLVLARVLPMTRDRWSEWVVRYSLFERLAHWSVALGYVLAFGTGALVLRWLGFNATREQLPILYVGHFVGAGLILVAAIAWVVAYRMRGSVSLLPVWRDIGPAVARLFGYLGVYGQSGVLGLRWPRSWQGPWQRALATFGVRPLMREAKFLAAEKVLSFTPLAILTVIVVGTGLVKAARYFYAVPSDAYLWATWLHDLTAWLTLVVVGLHVAAIVLVPRNWPGITAMITGRIRRDVVEEEFPAWADVLRRWDTWPEAAAPGEQAR